MVPNLLLADAIKSGWMRKLSEQHKGESFTYLLQLDQPESPVKIGCTRAPVNHLRMYIGASPYPLRLSGLALGDIERQLHEMFRGDRMHAEWYTWSNELDAIVCRFAVKADGMIEVADGHTAMMDERRHHRERHTAMHRMRDRRTYTIHGGYELPWMTRA